jgi:hypothetical protein
MVQTVTVWALPKSTLVRVRKLMYGHLYMQLTPAQIVNSAQSSPSPLFCTVTQTPHSYARKARATSSAGSALFIQQRPTNRLLLCGLYSGGCSIKEQGRLLSIRSTAASDLRRAIPGRAEVVPWSTRHPRPQKKIWLMQDSFIDKVAAKYNIAQRSTTYPAVPLVDGKIGISTEEPDDKRTKLYQELVGSLAYISTYTRPDVAQTHSELSRCLQNPGQKHISAAYHTWKYLIGQKRLVIGAQGGRTSHSHTIYTSTGLETTNADTEPLFYGASDAAFADDLVTPRSSQGYLFMLYGMPIDWRATLQRSVTKSTIEAELLALSTAASELQAWNRLFKHIKVDLLLRDSYEPGTACSISAAP